jgi:predicted  nucleic acid-binding Zn-ribbon protein
LFEALQFRIVSILDALNELKESPQYELHRLSSLHPNYLQQTAQEHASALAAEIKDLETQAVQLDSEISEISGNKSAMD